MMRCRCAAADYRFPARGIKQRASFSGPETLDEMYVHALVPFSRRREELS